MRAVLIDAFDSFVHVIDQYLRSLGVDSLVLRSAPGNLHEVGSLRPDLLVLGPGPGHPDDSGHVELVRVFAGTVPLLGVCLGHQAIGSAFGAVVRPAESIRHGKASLVGHDGLGLFAGASQPAQVTRYHSLIVDEPTLPDELVVTARSLDDGYVMGMRHRDLAIESVQFHPESIGTHGGLEMFRAFIDTHVRHGMDPHVSTSLPTPEPSTRPRPVPLGATS